VGGVRVPAGARVRGGRERLSDEAEATASRGALGGARREGVVMRDALWPRGGPRPQVILYRGPSERPMTLIATGDTVFGSFEPHAIAYSPDAPEGRRLRLEFTDCDTCDELVIDTDMQLSMVLYHARHVGPPNTLQADVRVRSSKGEMWTAVLAPEDVQWDERRQQYGFRVEELELRVSQDLFELLSWCMWSALTQATPDLYAMYK